MVDVKLILNREKNSITSLIIDSDLPTKKIIPLNENELRQLIDGLNLVRSDLFENIDVVKELRGCKVDLEEQLANMQSEIDDLKLKLETFED